MKPTKLKGLTAREEARLILKWYKEGSDLTEEETHVLNDTALEHNQILENVMHMTWFELALTENIQALK